MKNVFLLALGASAVVAHSNHHHRRYHHLRRGVPSKVIDKREPALVTNWVAETEVVYLLNGEVVPVDEAESGLDSGAFFVVDETTPNFVPPPSKPSVKAAFVETKIIESASSSEPPKSTPIPSQKEDSSLPPSNDGGQGLDRKFESNKYPCSEFPSDFGPIPIDWMEIGGWSGVQHVPLYSPGDASISRIDTAVSGGGCTKGSFCSYACPPGYEKTQWPEAQGSTKESIGGLYCNENGKLELTRATHPYLCQRGAGGVFIKNELSQLVSTCRTDYPGTESMVIPAVALPGGTVELANTVSDDYYIWDGKKTTAQYYINKAGYEPEDACVWKSSKDPEGAGNWSPLNIGVGKASDGNTYVGLFPNAAVSSAKIDFNIEITGGSSKCGYVDGSFIGGNGDGCTTSFGPGGKITIRYF